MLKIEWWEFLFQDDDKKGETAESCRPIVEIKNN